MKKSVALLVFLVLVIISATACGTSNVPETTASVPQVTSQTSVASPSPSTTTEATDSTPPHVYETIIIPTPIPTTTTTKDRLMQAVIEYTTNRAYSYVLEHRVFLDPLSEPISCFKEEMLLYFTENDPKNIDLAMNLLSEFLEINSEHSQLILRASDNPGYIVDYDGALYDSNSDLPYLNVTNPVIDVETGYAIASLEWDVLPEYDFGNGFLRLYKYKNGLLEPLPVYFEKEILFQRP